MAKIAKNIANMFTKLFWKKQVLEKELSELHKKSNFIFVFKMVSFYGNHW